MRIYYHSKFAFFCTLMSSLRLSRSWVGHFRRQQCHSLILSQVVGPRLYSTTSPKNSNNLPLILLGIGAVSAGGYWYLDRNESAKPKQEKSPFDPQNFIDFKLKKVQPYNHNSSTYL